MSRAHDRITAVLTENSSWTVEQIRHVADLLLPIVRDAVARGFDRAAEELDAMELPNGESDCIDWLRLWAIDARTPVRHA